MMYVKEVKQLSTQTNVKQDKTRSVPQTNK